MPEDNDTNAWNEFASEVKPLKGKERVGKSASSKSKSSKSGSSTVRVNSPKPLPAHAPIASSAPARHYDTLRHGERSQVDGTLARKLQRGELLIEGVLDLHGVNKEQALHQLEQFILRAASTGRRCVLVITGKGSRSPEGQDTLQKLVPRWINETSARNHVLMFDYATPKDGGKGALYILLRKQK